MCTGLFATSDKSVLTQDLMIDVKSVIVLRLTHQKPKQYARSFIVRTASVECSG